MVTRLKTPPAVLAVPLADARRNLQYADDETHDDPKIEIWLDMIIAAAEEYASHALIHQTFTATLDAFPDAIVLERTPVASVTHVRFRAPDGTWQTLDPQDYQVDTVSVPGYVVPAPGKAWPATSDRINSVEVEFIAGYGAGPSAIPRALRGYVLGKLREQYDPASRPEKETIQASFLDGVLDHYRDWS